MHQNKTHLNTLMTPYAMYLFYGFIVAAEGLLSPEAGERVSCSVMLLFLAPGVALAALAWRIYQDQTQVFNISRVFRSLLSAEGFNAYDAFGVLALIALIGWITDAWAEGWWWLALLQALNLWTFLVLFHRCSPVEEVATAAQTIPAKYLYLGLSTFNAYDKDKDLTPEGLQDLLKDPGWETTLQTTLCNWAPLLRTVAHHLPALTILHVVTSKESRGQLDSFKRLIDLLKPAGKSMTISVPEPVNMDNANEIIERVGHLMQQTRLTPPKDTCFYISGGTSAVSAAFMLLAVRNRHQAEYLAQRKNAAGYCDILSVNINARLNA